MRIVTRADLDGIACAVLLKDVMPVDDYLFTEAFPLQHGQVAVQGDDVITNLPYHPACAMWFDHHASNEPTGAYPGKWSIEPSAARVVFDYYLSDQLSRFERMVIATDAVDSANLTAAEIAHPSEYFLLELTINPKREADEPYWRMIIDALHKQDGEIEPVLAIAECRKRADVVLAELEEYHTVLARCSRLDQNVAITDFRGVERVPSENRFLIYGLFPAAEVSLKLAEVRNDKGHMVKISLGRSIVNRHSNVNLGELLARYGGGGHAAAGSVHVPFGSEEPVLAALLAAIRKN